MDPAGELFPTMHVASAMYTRVDATAPWGIDFRAYPHAKFGIVLQGRCWMSLEGSPRAIPLARGDYYMLPRGHAFTLRDDPESPTRSCVELLQDRGRDHAIRYGGGGAPTTVIGGLFEFDQPGRPALLDLLPDLIHVTVEQSKIPDLEATLRLLASETELPSLGSRLVVNRVADILFVQTIRAHLDQENGRKDGWLGAARDGQISQALRLMHERAGRPWTIEMLAAEVGLSRSAFASRFKALVGEAPLEYLTRCRMQKAAQLLRENDMKIMEVAERIGYESEGAFNKAFKRHLGTTPGKFRRNGN
jgi:AraC-like DNA-binding protein